MNFKNLHFVVLIPTREDDRGEASSLPQPVAALSLSGMDYPLLAAIPRLRNGRTGAGTMPMNRLDLSY
jgi:hypothetical protein